MCWLYKSSSRFSYYLPSYFLATLTDLLLPAFTGRMKKCSILRSPFGLSKTFNNFVSLTFRTASSCWVYYSYCVFFSCWVCFSIYNTKKVDRQQSISNFWNVFHCNENNQNFIICKVSRIFFVEINFSIHIFHMKGYIVRKWFLRFFQKICSEFGSQNVYPKSFSRTNLFIFDSWILFAFESQIDHFLSGFYLR